MNKRKITFASLLTLLFSLQVFPALAKDEIYTSFFSNKAVGGYDTVAYFTEGRPVEGSDKFKTEYKDTVWYFSSAENLKKFKADPEKYAPQYGGYCAWAVGQGYTASGDPKQWHIDNGKLYLNYDAEVKAEWLKDKAKWIEAGDKNWPKVIN
ncbi:YHS domain-containing (seleno)protein [Endozoicomonadaceae bacterium StTr2]